MSKIIVFGAGGHAKVLIDVIQQEGKYSVGMVYDINPVKQEIMGYPVIHDFERLKKLGIKAIPLRFVNLLLEKPIIIEDKGLKIKVPNPINFCLQKLIISTRRTKSEKKHKDVQQAICTSSIIDMKDFNKEYMSLPIKWRKAILESLNSAKNIMPLYNKDIERILSALQKSKLD